MMSGYSIVCIWRENACATCSYSACYTPLSVKCFHFRSAAAQHLFVEAPTIAGNTERLFLKSLAFQRLTAPLLAITSFSNNNPATLIYI